MIKICRYCGGKVICISTKAFYGRDYGAHVYKCTGCDAYVGTHKGTKNPLGTLANKELRELRKKAHEVFDPCWKDKHMQRKSAYRRLKEFMGTAREDTHIAMFDEDQCRRVIAGFKRFVLTGEGGST
ncbi:zinc-finger-containing protein [Paenibacillus donghaensis]|uniref:Uncharacterized protein n=1 Tax=Paenibacillus donghaensis TaxID=414771 RepID=A0A2Z2KDV9_9BACL|nr:zinc-finger-containing protein [Paenibacillus donghaensis]ASA22025.1 hypothetical protein B9T62_15330 [Paenibacillus donghaensis]